MAESRNDRIAKILSIAAPLATGEALTRAINFTGKVLDAIDQLDGMKKKRPRAGLTIDELRDFNRFYSVYPRKQDRGHAENMFRWALAQTDIEAIVQGAVRYAESVKGKERQMVAHPGTWLKGKRWLDEFPPPSDQSAVARSAKNQRESLITLARKGFATQAMSPDIIEEAKRLGPL